MKIRSTNGRAVATIALPVVGNSWANLIPIYGTVINGKTNKYQGCSFIFFFLHV